MNLEPAEVEKVKSSCLRTLAERGIIPIGKALHIQSGTLGIRQLGKVDFLVNLGYSVFWRHGR